MAAFLTPDAVELRRIGNVTLRVNRKIMPDGLLANKDVASYVRAGQPMKPCAPLHGDGIPQGITIHNTEMISVQTGTNAAEQYARATYNGNMGGVVVHYYVWHDVIWQLLSDRERGWHATDGSTRRATKDGGGRIGGNLDTIAIEAIGADAQTEATTAALAAWLCREYALLPDRDVYPHRWFYPAKNCPAYIIPHWGDFLARVRAAYLADASAAKTQQDAASDAAAAQDEPDAWAREAWEWCRMMGYMDGTRPRDAVTRQELAVVLERLENNVD